MVSLPLDNPHLANLIKLQRPHVGERIGIKYADSQHYVLMLDRLAERADLQGSPYEQQLHNTQIEVQDDSYGATEEERNFIEQALTENLASDTIETHIAESAGIESALRQIIQIQQEQITRQTDTISKLEELLASAIEKLGNKTQPIPPAAARPTANYPALLIWFFSSCIVGLCVSWLMHYYQVGWFH